jgi:hypothetical protein
MLYALHGCEAKKTGVEADRLCTARPVTIAYVGTDQQQRKKWRQRAKLFFKQKIHERKSSKTTAVSLVLPPLNICLHSVAPMHAETSLR